ARHPPRPAFADHAEDLAAVVKLVVRHGEPRLALERLELEAHARGPLLRHMFVERLPAVDEATRRIALDDRIVVREASGRIDGGHALARLPVGLHPIAKPV